MRTLALTLTILSVPCAALAQSRIGKIREGSLYYNPTPHTALEQLLEEKDPEPAAAVLTQKFDTWPASELDAFADELVRVLLESDDSSTRSSAQAALFLAGRASSGGTPYTRAVDTFIDLYEAARGEPYLEAESYLLAAYFAGGEEYVHNLFKVSPMPPSCWPGYPAHCPHTGPWCNAAYCSFGERQTS